MAANQSLPSFAQAFSSIPGPKHASSDDDPSPAPPHKRRRVTISGAPHPLVTDVPLDDHPSSTPISPVVMGLTPPVNPLAIEKVKSMISVKQKQKALIQQRRGSAAGPASPPRPRNLPPSRPSSPPPTHALPPPPISFARRRAEQLGSARKKPADILISPREAPLQPAIQSAPPLAHGRFSMALPRLPAVLATTDTRRVASAVPPTPTSLSLHRAAPRRSPPSVPIATTLVPATPGLADKAAFLAPFELFYDALNDSKQLKSWLADQLQRSNVLTQQHEKLHDLVDMQVAPMRQEILALQRRVDELEDALRAKHKPNRTPLRNGISSSPLPTESYTFPPAAALEPSLSSRRRTDRDALESEPPESTPRRIDASRSLPLEPPPLPPPPRLSPRVPFDHATSSPKLKAPAERPALSRQPSTHSSTGDRDEKRRNSESVLSEG